MDNLNDLKRQLKLLNPKVVKKLDIVSSEDLGQDYLIHISFIKTKELVPYISPVMNNNEDNTVPKIYTSQTIMNALEGIPPISYFIKNKRGGVDSLHIGNKDRLYHGGYYIYKIPFKYALKPKGVIAPLEDKFSNEHWLVTYNEATLKYQTELVGCLIPLSFTTEPWYKEYATVQIDYQLELVKPILFKPNLLIDPGYYTFDDKHQTLNTISKSEYSKTKSEKAKSL